MDIVFDNLLKQYESGNVHDLTPISYDQVKIWLLTEDLEILGALWYFFNRTDFRNRIEPPLSFIDFQKLFLHFFERCMLENPQGEFACTRYEVGWNMVNWFYYLWNDEQISRYELSKIKFVLTRLYKIGDQEVKTCIVTAVLEHLFENRDIASYFKDWEDDPVLARAYSDGMLWSKE